MFSSESLIFEHVSQTVICLNQYPIAMIHLMLNDLRRPACVSFDSRLHIGGLILHLNRFITLAPARAAEKRQASFLRVICTISFDNLRVEHYGICRLPSAFVKKCNNAFFHADHVRRHADTGFLVRHQRIKQVLRDLQIVFCCNFRFPRKKNRVVHEFFNHPYHSLYIRYLVIFRYQ